MKFSRRSFALTLMVLASCGGTAPPESASEESSYYDIVIDSHGETGFEARPPGYVPITDPEYFAKIFPAIIADTANKGLQIRFVAGSDVTSAISKAIGAPSYHSEGQTWPGLQPQDWELHIGKYVLTTGCGRGPVSGCVSATADKCNLRLHVLDANGRGIQLLDIHVAKWRDSSGRLCVGLMDSGPYKVIDYCPPCAPNGKDLSDARAAIRDAITSAFLVMGIGALAAWALSAAATPALMVGLAL